MTVLIVSRDPARRAELQRRAASAGLTVVGAASAIRMWSDLAGLDAVVVDESDLRDVDILPDVEGATLVLLVFAKEAAAAEAAARLGARGIVVIPPERTDADVAALLRAASEGFAVTPTEWLPRVDELDDVRGRDRRIPEPVESGEPLVEALTSREQDVFELLASGLSNRRIAESLGISEHTVKFHVASIYGKLGVTTRAAAVRRGLRRGLVTA